MVPELSEIEMNRKLLVDAEVALKGTMERLTNIRKSVSDLKKKLGECVDKFLWDQAQDILNQTHKLSVDATAAEENVKQAQARVDGLKLGIVKAEEKARKDAMPAPYKPYTPEPILPDARTAQLQAQPAPVGTPMTLSNSAMLVNPPEDQQQ